MGKKLNKDLLEMGDEAINKDMRKNYPQLLYNGHPEVKLPDETKYPPKDPKSCVAHLS
jgi:hypothetical protein